MDERDPLPNMTGPIRLVSVQDRFANLPKYAVRVILEGGRGRRVRDDDVNVCRGARCTISVGLGHVLYGWFWQRRRENGRRLLAVDYFGLAHRCALACKASQVCRCLSGNIRGASIWFAGVPWWRFAVVRDGIDPDLEYRLLWWKSRRVQFFDEADCWRDVSDAEYPSA